MYDPLTNHRVPPLLKKSHTASWCGDTTEIATMREFAAGRPMRWPMRMRMSSKTWRLGSLGAKGARGMGLKSSSGVWLIALTLARTTTRMATGCDCHQSFTMCKNNIFENINFFYFFIAADLAVAPVVVVGGGGVRVMVPCPRTQFWGATPRLGCACSILVWPSLAVKCLP